jgi:hypothetical protein
MQVGTEYVNELLILAIHGDFLPASRFVRITSGGKVRGTHWIGLVGTRENLDAVETMEVFCLSREWTPIPQQPSL